MQCSRKHTLWSSQRGYGKILQPSTWFNIWESPSCCASELLICNPLKKIQTYLIHLSWYLSQLWFRTHRCYKCCQKWLMLGVRYVWPLYEMCMKYNRYIQEWLAQNHPLWLSSHNQTILAQISLASLLHSRPPVVLLVVIVLCFVYYAMVASRQGWLAIF